MESRASSAVKESSSCFLLVAIQLQAAVGGTMATLWGRSASSEPSHSQTESNVGVRAAF